MHQCLLRQSESTYFYQVFDDNRWWISRYQYLKGVYYIMIYVGIDVAQLNHFASAISSDGKALIELFQFTNDVDGFYLLSSRLDSLSDGSLIIGLESTAYSGGTLLVILLLKVTKSVSSTRSSPRLCEKAASAKPRRIRFPLFPSLADWNSWYFFISIHT